MRQVPAASEHGSSPVHYLLIGDGRLAGHLRAYLSLENLPFTQWSRRLAARDANLELEALIARSTHVLLAVSDAAIDGFVAASPAILARACVHFSGAVVSERVPSAHPLMTFAAHSPMTLDAYHAIPFVFERGRGSMSTLLPGFSNRGFEIDAEQKPLYHALCAMSGNFTVLLWEKVFADFAAKLGLPAAILRPYLSQVAQNLLLESAQADAASVLTGPLVRGDQSTIAKHLRALGNDPFAGVYEAFVSAYRATQQKKPDVMTFPLGGSL